MDKRVIAPPTQACSTLHVARMGSVRKKLYLLLDFALPLYCSPLDRVDREISVVKLGIIR